MSRRAVLVIGLFMAWSTVTAVGCSRSSNLEAGGQAPTSTEAAPGSIRPFGEPSPTTVHPTTTATPETTTTTVAPRRFTLAFTGDVLLHSRVNAVAAAYAARTAAADGSPGGADRRYDYRPMLEPIRPWVEAADWAVCHLEVNVSADGTRLSSYPSFRAPGQVAFDLADLGYDSCTLASNHILDKGFDGVMETLDVVESAGLHPIGAARSEAHAEEQRLVDVEGVTVAHLAYTYWFNGIPLPRDAPWLSNPIDADRILNDAATARRDGAEYVVVSLHWGQQYRHQPTTTQVELGHRLLNSPDIDLIVGHHAHVVQPIDQVNGKWLIYGLGNLVSNSSQPERRDELLVVATVSEDPAGSFTTDLEVVPLHLDHATMTVYPTNPATRPVGLDPGLSPALDASWARVLEVLWTEGGDSHYSLG